MVEKGKCIKCGKDITPGAMGYCNPCATEVYAERDREYPFFVYGGTDDHPIHEEFKTREEADEFCDSLRFLYVEEK